ncbi:hypothetical protein [Actinoplanes sp. NPDC049265]|uniref:hypothetical protein n=1 Tax=Actinoplanes sp. NPDC049265 TaxID=3363902 RepID=UPI00370FFB35
MTADEFGTVDVDLLADYIGDALDGPEQERVARLVAEDPEWRSAFALLSPGMGSVSAELGAMGAAAEPMPETLWVRLSDAFSVPPAAASDPPVESPVAEPSIIDPALATPTAPHLAPVRGDRHLVSVPTGRSSDGKPSSRRRRLRWAAPIAAAAGVVAFAGLGASYLSGNNSADDATSSAGSAQLPLNAPEAAPAQVGGLTGEQITASGVDYSERSLRAANPIPPADPMIATDQGGSADGTQRSQKSAESRPLIASDPALSRLTARDALAACLHAIAVENAGGPITVQTIDYARFAGAPALIVRFTANGVAQAWAAGPDCGAPDRGAQAVRRVRVG